MLLLFADDPMFRSVRHKLGPCLDPVGSSILTHLSSHSKQ